MAVRYTVSMPDPEAPEEREEQGQEKWYERMRYQILLFTGGIALFILVGGWILDSYTAPQTPAQKMDLIQALGLITAGVAGAVGIFFTWRGQRLTQESLEDTRKNLRVTREGQITDRFTRAIDQLGKVEDGKKLFEIRVGGIYALERIARESEEDYGPIMEILPAYVRQNAPLPSQAGQERTEDAIDEQRAMEGSRGKPETTEPSAPDPDIQAIMTVLRRRALYHKREGPELLDLSDTNLIGADLSGANLIEAQNLTQEQLEQALGDENSQLPPHLKPPAHWGVKTDEQPEED
jgi:Pentapeptide repeats (8 copies)